jgi:multiple sugar transport system ATP-binding protein
LRSLGGKFLLGVRPEDLYESSPRAGDERVIPVPAQVVAVEPLGAETLIVLALDGIAAEVIARGGRESHLRAGARTTIMLDTAAIHLFDPTTTRVIPRRAA